MPSVGRLHGANPRTLRLVGIDEHTQAPRTARRRAAVASENRQAAALDLEDARIAFALRVAERLDGGRAAILTPETRRRLLHASSKMGLEPFDASLVIAIVQDAARRGETTDEPMTAGRLKLVKPAKRRAAFDGVLLPAAAAIILALIALVSMMSWITR